MRLLHFITLLTGGLLLAGSGLTASLANPDTGTLTRVSVATAGTHGTQDSYLPYPGLGISADGSVVVFCTQATLELPDLDNGMADIYLRQTAIGTTRLISVAFADNRKAYRCALSGDGQAVVYYTEDGNALIHQDLASGIRQTLVILSSYLSNSGPGISDDGTQVIYEKDGKVWRLDREAGTKTEASVNSQGETADRSCGDIAISADGQAIAFSSTATNLAGANADGIRSVYLRLPGPGQTFLISTTATGQPVANAIKPALSATGRFVAFLADDGTVGDGIGTMYVKNSGSGVLRQIAVDAANPAISADGRFVGYMKTGANGKNQLYRKDLTDDQDAPQLVSHAAGLEGDGDSYRAVLSASGRFVAFASQATNLVPGDSNGKCDIFLNDFGIPQNHLPVPTLAPLTADEDTPLTDIALTYADPEDNDVRVEIVSGPAHADQYVLHGLQPGQEKVTFTYVPVANYNGTDSFTYRCGDADGWSAPVTVTITVRPVNDLPRWIGMPALWAAPPGAEFRLDLSRFVNDPDTRNDNPDVLHFSLLQGAPEAWLEGSVLVLAAAALAEFAPVTFRVGVADREDGPVIEFSAALAINVHPPVEIALAPGWNLVSFPLMPEPSDPARLLTKPWGAGTQSLYQGPVWYWDAEAASYRSAETLEPKRAYWVFCPAPASLTMQVAWLPPVDSTVELVAGWNLVGPVGFGEFAFPTWVATGIQISRENLWLWKGTHYTNPDQNVIECGQGSWIYSPTAQALDMALIPVE